MQTVALREVRAASRRSLTYWSRSAAGGVGALVLLSFSMGQGRTMFISAVVVAFLLCLLEGVRLGSASIVDERLEGTLGLLLLTPLRGSELLLGKLAALGFFSMQTLLALAPVMALSMMMGGVSGGEVLRAALGLAQSLLVALTCGLVISAHSRDSTRAMIWTFVLLIGGAIVMSLKFWPSAGWPGFIYNSLNPFTPIWTISDLRYQIFRLEYFLSFVVSAIVCFLALRSASRSLAINFASTEAAVKSPRRVEASSVPEVKIGKSRAQWFSGNPIQWLTLRNFGCTRLIRRQIPFWGAVCFSAAMIAIKDQGLIWGFLALPVFGFIYSVCCVQTFARARQSGELELWLTTPLTISEIVKGHLVAIRQVFFWPGLVLILTWCGMFYELVLHKVLAGAASVSISGPGYSSMSPEMAIVYILASTLISFIALLLVLPHVAMWIALKAKSPAQAAVRTFLLMVVCPWFVVVIPKVLLLVPIGMIANHYVRRNLKNFATLRAQPR